MRVIGYEACAETETPCEIIVPEGATVLKDRCFCYCTDVDLYLPASVTVISPIAFYDRESRGPILHVMPGRVAEAFGNEKGLRCIPREAE